MSKFSHPADLNVTQSRPQTSALTALAHMRAATAMMMRCISAAAATSSRRVQERMWSLRVDDTLYLNTLANQQSKEKTYFLHSFYYSRTHACVFIARRKCDMRAMSIIVTNGKRFLLYLCIMWTEWAHIKWCDKWWRSWSSFEKINLFALGFIESCFMYHTSQHWTKIRFYQRLV